MLKVAESKKKLHIISALDLGVIEKNIVNKETGIIDVWGDLVEYNRSGKGQHTLPHLIFHTNKGNKVIYLLGYDNVSRWKKVLGGQYGSLYIDEINIADMDYLREIFMRCDYILGTLNPDDPNLPVYKEFINKSRPIDKYVKDTPKQILEELTEEPNPDWAHWFFSFKDNLYLTDEKLNQIYTNVPRGTKLWKNKIEGLRGKATGLVFNVFDKKHIISSTQAKTYEYQLFSCGVDTSYSDSSLDTICFIFEGITEDGILITLKEEVYNNKNLDKPLAPSDVVSRLFDFLERCRAEYGFARYVYIDSADSATLTEARKFKRNNACMYEFMKSTKLKNIDRIYIELGWMQENEEGKIYHYIVDECTEHIKELNMYAWKEDKHEPEDRNDHTINANQYGWAPYRDKIGFKKKQQDYKKATKLLRRM